MDSDAMPKCRLRNRITKGKAPETYNTDHDVETMRKPQKVQVPSRAVTTSRRELRAAKEIASLQKERRELHEEIAKMHQEQLGIKMEIAKKRRNQQTGRATRKGSAFVAQNWKRERRRQVEGLCSKTSQCTCKPEIMWHAAGKRAVPGSDPESPNICASEVL